MIFESQNSKNVALRASFFTGFSALVFQARRPSEAKLMQFSPYTP